MNIFILTMYDIQCIVQLDVLVTSRVQQLLNYPTESHDIQQSCIHITNTKYIDRLSGWMILDGTTDRH